MFDNKIPLFCCVLLLVCLNKACYGDPRMKSPTQELKAALQRDLKARDDFKLYTSKLKNVESSTLLSAVTSHIEDAKRQLDATNSNSKCVQDATNYLQTLQTHANVIFRTYNPRISDLTTPEDQQYQDVVGNELAAAVENLIQACNQPETNSKCDSATLNALTQRETTFGRSVEPLRQANSNIRPLYNTLTGIMSQYQSCLSHQ